MLDAESPRKGYYPVLSFPQLIMLQPMSGYVTGERGGWLLAGLQGGPLLPLICSAQ